MTTKGRETRRRIVESAADLIVERGVGAVSLDEVGRVTATSKSQMYHYFTNKEELVAAVVICARDRILTFHGGLLASVESLDDLQAWAESIVVSQRQARRWSGCPLGRLASELIGDTEIGRLDISEGFDSWQLLLADALRRLQGSGETFPGRRPGAPGHGHVGLASGRTPHVQGAAGRDPTCGRT